MTVFVYCLRCNKRIVETTKDEIPISMFKHHSKCTMPLMLEFEVLDEFEPGGRSRRLIHVSFDRKQPIRFGITQVAQQRKLRGS